MDAFCRWLIGNFQFKRDFWCEVIYVDVYWISKRKSIVKIAFDGLECLHNGQLKPSSSKSRLNETPKPTTLHHQVKGHSHISHILSSPLFLEKFNIKFPSNYKEKHNPPFLINKKKLLKAITFFSQLIITLFTCLYETLYEVKRPVSLLCKQIIKTSKVHRISQPKKNWEKERNIFAEYEN